jgi:glucosamine--fructose-6-phosphate aminotransferase (isomerizing)
MNRCTHCLLPETYPRLLYDAEGKCSICRNPPKTGYVVLGLPRLDAFLERYRKPEGYECIVALSGGRDSSFTLNYVVKELKLKTLAVTFDNGYMPEQTRINIQNCVKLLNVDHVMYHYDYTIKSVKSFVKAWTRKPDPALIAFACNGCMTGLMKGLYRTAEKHNVKLIINGGGEPETSFAEPMLREREDLFGSRGALIYGTAKHLIRNPYYFFNILTLISFAREAYYRFYNKRQKEIKYVSLFNYLAWDEKMIESVITQKLNWKRAEHFTSDWRSDCDIHLLKQYFYRELLGFTKNDEMLSNLIRMGKMSREEAAARLAVDNDLPENFIEEFLARHGVDVAKMKDALRQSSFVRD